MIILQKIIGLLLGYGGLISIYLLHSYILRLLVIILVYLLAHTVKGSQTPILYVLFGFIQKPYIFVKGYVKPGYEQVKEEFEKNFINGMEQGSQVSVYVQGENVVNLTGIYNTYSYDENTIQCVMSTSKTVTTLVIAMLVEKNLLDYDEKISKYWPNFAKNGKQNVTLKEVLRHETGLNHISKDIKEDIMQKQSIKKNVIGQLIENSEQQFHPETRRSYHFLSRGYILNEVVRRVDPKKRTIGEIIHDELYLPHGIEFYMGVPSHKLIKVKDFQKTIYSCKLWFYIQSILPKFLGKKVACDLKTCKDLYKLDSYITNINGGMEFNNLKYRIGEAPSANGHSNALNLSKISSILATGKFNGKQILSQETLDKMISEPVLLKDSNLLMKKNKILKGGNPLIDKDIEPDMSEDSVGYIGCGGYGGSVVLYHPKQQIGFAYTPNLSEGDCSWARGIGLRDVVAKVVKQQEQANKKEK